MIRPFSFQNLTPLPAPKVRFGEQADDVDSHQQKVDYYVSKHLLGETDDPYKQQQRLDALRSTLGNSDMPREYYGEVHLPDPAARRDAYGTITEPAAINRLFEYFPFESTNKDDVSITWHNPPVTKQPHAVARKLGPMWPITLGDRSPEEFAFPFEKASVTVKLKSDEPGPLRGFRYEKDGRHHRLAIGWKNPDGHTQYSVFEYKVGNFENPLRRKKTETAFELFRSINHFLADRTVL